MNRVYYFPKLPLIVCLPGYIKYKDSPVLKTINKQCKKLCKDIEKNGLKDPLIGEVRIDREGLSYIETIVGIRRWTCLQRLGIFEAPFFVKGEKKDKAIAEIKYIDHKKIKNFEDAVKHFGNKDAPGTLVIKRWFPCNEESIELTV